jgi:DNA-binding protein YbaB
MRTISYLCRVINRVLWRTKHTTMIIGTYRQIEREIQEDRLKDRFLFQVANLIEEWEALNAEASIRDIIGGGKLTLRDLYEGHIDSEGYVISDDGMQTFDLETREDMFKAAMAEAYKMWEDEQPDSSDPITDLKAEVVV